MNRIKLEAIIRPKKLPNDKLPTNRQVLQLYYFAREKMMKEADTTKVPTFNQTKSIVIDVVKSLWDKASLPYVGDDRISQMLYNLFDNVCKLQSQPKDRQNSPSFLKKFDSFWTKFSELFE